VGEQSPVADANGRGVVAELWGAKSNIWPQGKQPERGLAPSNGPGETWGESRGRRRFTIRAVQRLPGRVKRVPRQIKVGLGMWQSCGGQVSILRISGNSWTVQGQHGWVKKVLRQIEVVLGMWHR